MFPWSSSVSENRECVARLLGDQLRLLNENIEYPLRNGSSSGVTPLHHYYATEGDVYDALQHHNGIVVIQEYLHEADQIFHTMRGQ